MLLKLNPDSGLPLYGQIAAAVRRAIGDGDIVPGERLPAARDLARSLDVNMHTVLRAYDGLRRDGLIELRRGRGAIVREGSVAAAGIHRLVVELAVEARRRGLDPATVVQMLQKELL